VRLKLTVYPFQTDLKTFQMKPEQYFKDYPGSEKCFQTSDETIFHQKGDAHLHAKSLKDDEVKEHKAVHFAKATEEKSDAKKVAKEPAKQAAGIKEPADKKEPAKSAKKATPEVTEPSNENK
jgi:hypothetical protein